jgi:Ca2+-binding RTX toxin-like protein
MAFDAGKGNDSISVQNSNQSHTLLGGEGKDYLYGGKADDRLEGGLGDDNIYGYEGVDTLIGGQGSDLLYGGLGADTYVFSKGDGHDRIIDTGSTSELGPDVIQFADVAFDDVVIGLIDDSLVLSYGENDSITVENFTHSQQYNNTRIEKFEFTDQTLSLYDLLDQSSNGQINLSALGIEDTGVSFVQNAPSTSIENQVFATGFSTNNNWLDDLAPQAII